MTPSEKAAKIERAIELGFIRRTRDIDGVYIYELTPLGAKKWMQEKIEEYEREIA